MPRQDLTSTWAIWVSLKCSFTIIYPLFLGLMSTHKHGTKFIQIRGVYSHNLSHRKSGLLTPLPSLVILTFTNAASSLSHEQFFSLTTRPELSPQRSLEHKDCIVLGAKLLISQFTTLRTGAQATTKMSYVHNFPTSNRSRIASPDLPRIFAQNSGGAFGTNIHLRKISQSQAIPWHSTQHTEVPTHSVSFGSPVGSIGFVGSFLLEPPVNRRSSTASSPTHLVGLSNKLHLSLSHLAEVRLDETMLPTYLQDSLGNRCPVS